MIELKGIEKSFGSQMVLHNVSCIFETGKVNFIIGRSGEGKSVLTKCMVGLMPVNAGTITYDGENFINVGRIEKKKILNNAVVFQRII